MRILVTGVTGYVGGLIAERLSHDGHEVRGLARRPDLAQTRIEVVAGDAVTGTGLASALRGVEVAYYLLHSMERPPAGSDVQAPFSERERVAAQRFADEARAAGVRRIVYLGGLLPAQRPLSAHLASRLAVERILLASVPDSVALRASIVIGARSRSFRFLVRLIERLPVLAIPAWRVYRTAPIDERDVVALLTAAATSDRVGGESLDIGGPEIVTYGELIDRIADAMLVARPSLGLRRLTLTPIASRVASVISGERYELVGPLMESLTADLVPGDERAPHLLGVRLHSLDAAIEHALAVWEQTEPLTAR